MITALILGAALILTSHVLAAQNKPSLIVVGFVGGFVQADDTRHGEVRVAQRLRSDYGNRVQVEVSENRNRAEAHAAILRWLDRKGDGKLTPEEKKAVPIVLFGGSWGASAAITLARELQKEGIPVALTIQVDSVSRQGENDSIIPSNVAEAANFYQPDGLVHGRDQIVAADAAKTKILGNYRFQYQETPAECRDYSWYNRLFLKQHIAMDCDPVVWSKVEELIRAKLK